MKMPNGVGMTLKVLAFSAGVAGIALLFAPPSVKQLIMPSNLANITSAAGSSAIVRPTTPEDFQDAVMTAAKSGKAVLLIASTPDLFEVEQPDAAAVADKYGDKLAVIVIDATKITPGVISAAQEQLGGSEVYPVHVLVTPEGKQKSMIGIPAAGALDKFVAAQLNVPAPAAPQTLPVPPVTPQLGTSTPEAVPPKLPTEADRTNGG